MSNGDGYLDLRGTYPSGGAYGYEDATRVVATGSGSSVTANGQYEPDGVVMPYHLIAAWNGGEKPCTPKTPEPPSV